MSKEAAEFRAMTEVERKRAILLGRCKFCPGSFSKRFAATMFAQGSGSRTITDKQAERLAIQCWIYRKQIEEMKGGAEILPESAPPGYQTPSERKAEAEAAQRETLGRARNAWEVQLRAVKERGKSVAIVVAWPWLHPHIRKWMKEPGVPTPLDGQTVFDGHTRQREPVVILGDTEEQASWINRKREERRQQGSRGERRLF